MSQPSLAPPPPSDNVIQDRWLWLLWKRVVGPFILPKTSGEGILLDPADPTFPWGDIIGAVNPKAIGAGSPTRAIYNGGNIGDYSFIANDVCDFIFHIPHDYVPNTDILFHVHWSHTGTTISGSAVFDVYYDYASRTGNGLFGTEKNITITVSTPDVATIPRYSHRVDETAVSASVATATLMAKGDIQVDGLLRATLKMTTLPTLGGGGKLFISTCDIHYQSTGIGTKQNSAATTGSFYV